MVHEQDEHFRTFIAKLAPILEDHGTNTDALQKYQLNTLQDLERKFRKALVRHKWGPDIYQAFVDHVVKVRRNILMARPFFRERDTTFKASISPCLKEADYRGLYQFGINYQFVEFVLKQKPWADGKTGRALLTIADEITFLRRDLVECNLPLAISQARMFLQHNRRSHLAYMDMTQTCAVGLLEGVDKYTGTWTKTFRAVLIGRMLGNLIESNSETFVHFFPPDKRRIYRARKILARQGQDGPPDMDDVCKQMNVIEAEREEPLTTVGELVNLLAAAQAMPASSLATDNDVDDETSAIEKFAAPADARPDAIVEDYEARQAVAVAIQGLSLMDQKLLRIKGVEL